ncbi:MAG: DUF5110 domain-containing protein [Bacteroidota bacterium]|nr:DUF5110 domain-containing protein [Bacteroidota bacterium]
MTMKFFGKAIPFFAALAICCSPDYTVDEHGITVRVPDPSPGQPANVRLTVYDSDIIRVEATPADTFAVRKSLAVTGVPDGDTFLVKEEGNSVILSTNSLKVKVDNKGRISFYDIEDNLYLKEAACGKTFEPVEVEGRQGYSWNAVFDSPDDEAFYGLGQHQSMEFNHKGLSEELFQYNTKISVPFVLSSRNYGILWDSYSFSRWGNPAPYRQLGKVFTLYDKDGREGSLTGTYAPAEGDVLVRQEDSLFFENEWAVGNLPKIGLKGAKVVYEGYLEAPETMDYRFILYYAGYQKVFIGGNEVVPERWRAAWNPNSYKFDVRLKKGERTSLRVEWLPDGDVSYMGLRVAEPQTGEERSKLSIWTEMSPEMDYYFIGGHSADDVISGYRTLTGRAQVMPKWVLGFWQSREHYSTASEITGAMAELRRRHIPVDNIVQDWQYWADDQWGSHEFEKKRYPDPEGMLDKIHALHGRFMISVWPKFYTNTAHYQELKAAGWVYPYAEEVGLKDWLGHEESFYDAYSEGGRKLFWKQMDKSLYSRYGRKVDAWWMDASEPNLRDCLPMEFQKALTTPTALGPSTEYLNAYALVNADAIYNGQRSVDPDKRVFLLTRSGFAGLQRYSTASWSGDIAATWLDMRAQMSAGLGYSMSGIPFWGMDIGGFTVEDRFHGGDVDEWRELQTRWHQFGAFVPIFRAHGQWPHRELWNIDPDEGKAYQSILYYMRLRYNMMPYLYSMAGWVNTMDYTIMRGLPMDFPADPAVKDISDQWMFGPAFMPCPVYEYGARSREVYLPEGSVWYDFYSGRSYSGGEKIVADAPYERMPLFVRGGSIVPMGPDMEWCDEKQPEVIDLYVYAGADCQFTLYEDDGLTYGYERGERSEITFFWTDSERELIIGERDGEYPGMLESRRFNVILVDPEHPVGYGGPGSVPGEMVEYDGKVVIINI